MRPPSLDYFLKEVTDGLKDFASHLVMICDQSLPTAQPLKYQLHKGALVHVLESWERKLKEADRAVQKGESKVGVMGGWGLLRD